MTANTLAALGWTDELEAAMTFMPSEASSPPGRRRAPRRLRSRRARRRARDGPGPLTRPRDHRWHAGSRRLGRDLRAPAGERRSSRSSPAARRSHKSTLEQFSCRGHVSAVPLARPLAQHSLIIPHAALRHTIFIIRYPNPDHFDQQDHRQLLPGPIKAIDVITETTGKMVNLLGLCLGGTLTMATLAYLRRDRFGRGSKLYNVAEYLDQLQRAHRFKCSVTTILLTSSETR